MRFPIRHVLAGRGFWGWALVAGCFVLAGWIEVLAEAGRSAGVPLFFAEAGRGGGEFWARTPGFSALLESGGVDVWVAGRGAEARGRLGVRLLGARGGIEGVGEDYLGAKLNLLVGRDRTDWTTGKGTFGKVRFSGVYPGVDVVYYGNDERLEYDFVVGAGVDPGVVRLGLEGARGVRLGASGDLLIGMGGGELCQRRPVAYQDVGQGVRKRVEAGYILREVRGGYEVGFELGEYDRGLPLVIDPVVVYAAYLGGSAYDVARRMVLQESGRVVVVGETASLNMPVVDPLLVTNVWGAGGLMDFWGGENAGGPGADVGNILGTDAMVAGFSADGSTLEFCTYLGGGAIDAAVDVAEDAEGNLLVYGLTQSADFPVVTNAWVGLALREVCQTNLVDGVTEVSCEIALTNAWPVPSGWDPVWKTEISGEPYWGYWPFDAFLTKLTPGADDILFSLYAGSPGDEQGMRVAVDGWGRIYTAMIRDQSAGAPVVTCMDGDGLGYVQELLTTGVVLGLEPTEGGELWVVGETRNALVLGDWVDAGLLPEEPYQPLLAGATDGFLARLGVDGEIRYTSYLGGAGDDSIRGLLLSDDGGVVVAGHTTSISFPVESALVSTNAGYRDLFVARLDASLTNLVYSTYLGGRGEEYLERLAGDADGELLLAGWTLSTNFPGAVLLPSTTGDTKEGLLVRMLADGSGLLSSTLFGGEGNEEVHDVVVDGEGYYWITGLSQGGLEANYGGVVETNWWNVVLKTNTVPPVITKRSPAAFLARLYPGEAEVKMGVVDGGVAISWPEALRGFELQSVSGLSGATNQWIDLSGAVLVGTNRVYGVTNRLGEEFYRLRQRVGGQP